MSKEIIKLPKIENYGMNDLYDAYEHLLSAKNKICKVYRGFDDKTINSVIDETQSHVKQMYNLESERFSDIEKLLMKYYKVVSYKRDFYEGVFYVFPYSASKCNHCIFTLFINPSNCYLGGIVDRSFELEEIMKRDIELQEISKEEFMEQAKLSMENAMNYRLKKINDVFED